jgi:hypothetical protein
MNRPPQPWQIVPNESTHSPRRRRSPGGCAAAAHRRAPDGQRTLGTGLAPDWESTVQPAFSRQLGPRWQGGSFTSNRQVRIGSPWGRERNGEVLVAWRLRKLQTAKCQHQAVLARATASPRDTRRSPPSAVTPFVLSPPGKAGDWRGWTENQSAAVVQTDAPIFTVFSFGFRGFARVVWGG